MPMEGTLAADFSAFTAECAKADAGLASLQDEAAKTEAAVTGMAGGTADAMAKTASGTTAAGTAAKDSASGFTTLAGGLKAADKTLGAFGVQLGPQISALEELGQVSGKTAGELGKLGTATAVAGAAVAGWNIGRWIAQITGSDKAIGDATASLLGWRDAGQASANNAEVLQRAFEKTGKVFTDVHAASEALRAASRDSGAQFATTANLVTQWERELSKAKGGVAALRGEIEAGNLTTDQMTARFRVSAEAIDYLKRNMGLAAEETRKKAAADKDAAAEAQRHADAIKRLQESMFGTDTINKATQYVAALGGVENLTRMERDALASMNTELGKAIEAYARLGKTAPAALNEIYIASLPLPPMVAGLEAAWNGLGVAIPDVAGKIVADIKQIQKATADYEAETQRQADAWNRGERAADGVTRATDTAAGSMRNATGSASQLTVQLSQLTTQMTAYESAIAGAQLLQGYADAGIATSHAISMGGYEFDQLKKTGVPGGWGGVQWADRTPTNSTPWGGGNTLTVNVNNADAKGVADTLVREMRHSGIRL